MGMAGELWEEAVEPWEEEAVELSEEGFAEALSAGRGGRRRRRGGSGGRRGELVQDRQGLGRDTAVRLSLGAPRLLLTHWEG